MCAASRRCGTVIRSGSSGWTEGRGRGYSRDLFVDPPGRAWIDFVHASNELVTVMAGELELTIAGASLRAGPGDEVRIPRRARHSVRNVHRGTTRWLYGYD